MDLYCPRCKEPWDNDSLHEEVEARVEAREDATYQSVYREFITEGCEALGTAFDGEHNSTAKDSNDPVLSEIYGMCGDDSDAAASLIEDADMMGLI